MSAEWTEQHAALPAPGMDLGVWGPNDIADRSFEKALDPLVRSQPLLRGGRVPHSLTGQEGRHRRGQPRAALAGCLSRDP